MSRRALPKIDPTLDLSQHLRTVDQLPQPWSADALFGRTAALELEVGSGKGLFLCTAARQHADRDFLGIEVSGKYACFAAAQLAQLELSNACVVHGDAHRVLAELLPDACLDAVHIYFPDPWWKRRHHKRRIMTAGFLHDCARTLKPDGDLHFWTDVETYFNEALDVLGQLDQFEGPLEVEAQSAEHAMDYRTHFERRVRMHDEPVYRSRYHRR